MTSIIRRMRQGALLVPLALLLSACGSSSDNDSAQAPPPVATTPPPPVGDAFFNTISANFFAMTDVEEPVQVDAIATTAPENTEPDPVQ
ncbi:hypothetical protein [Massilia sp. LjRoot122]|uniref:hypothetical protein n=1 Tax=Massilia sp. LjRoot122 TaxID=3342257 RepID=UPI003ECF027B